MLPLSLDGTSLGRRHQQLNSKVKEIVSTSFNFDEIKKLPEETDVDRLFKIDLASKIEDTNFIIETLKCGDEFYVSRALKCSWLYDEQHADIINCDFLHNNVFPFMSQAMVKKTLTAISVHLKNDARIFDFYMYCNSNKTKELANKFLSRTSTDTKLMAINKDYKRLETLAKVNTKIIGNSFILAEAYLTNVSSSTKNLYHLRYLYAVSNEQYLSLLEKHISYSERSWKSWKFGLRLSKDIILKHKNRILRNPPPYVKVLNLKTMLKYLKVDDIKTIIPSLLPAKIDEFWNENCYDHVKEFLNALPIEERFCYFKNIYQNKYPLSEFEMSKQFYSQRMYMLMTERQKEAWALKQLESNNEILGNNRDYKWYQFVDFTKSFVEIKKWIYKAKSGSDRLSMLIVIIRCAKTPKDIFTLLTYLYQRHKNEQSNETFVEEIIKTHNVLEFDDACWNMFNKLLHCIGVYNPEKSYGLSKPQLVVLLYHILHGKPLPVDLLEEYIFGSINLLQNETSFCEILQMVPETKHSVIFESVSQTLTDRLAKYDVEGIDSDKILHIVRSFRSLNRVFKKVGYPNVFIEFFMRNKDLQYLISTEFPQNKPLTEKQLLPLLNKDILLFIGKISDTIEQPEVYYRVYIKKLLRKLKIYFFNDVAKLWLKKSMECLNSATNVAIFSIFHLADHTQKRELMMKYAPENPKIEYDVIDRKLMEIQEAICRFSMYSRPPVPLNFIQMYLKGDYVHYCCPIFDFYAAHLPYSDCSKFVESLLDAPVSIQKHGIKLVFRSSLFNELRQPIQRAWRKSRNPSLRYILFLAVYDEVCNENNELRRREKYEFLKAMVENLNKDDNESIFEKICFDYQFPTNLCGEFIETVFVMFQKMPDNIHCMEVCKDRNLDFIADRIDYMREVFIEDLIQTCINDTHLAIETGDFMQTNYFNAKQKLIARYLIANKSEVTMAKKMTVLEKIIKHSVAKWDQVKNDIYVTRKFFSEFLETLSYYTRIYKDDYVTPVTFLELLVKQIRSNLPIQSTYLIIWKLKLLILSTIVIYAFKEQNSTDETSKLKASINTFAKGLSVLLDQFIEEKLYFPSMLPEIVNIIEEYISQISLHIRSDNELVKTLVASEFLNIDSVPSCLIVVNILPLDSSDKYEKEYHDVLEKLRMSNDSEVMCVYYKKFCNNFKRRKYL